MMCLPADGPLQASLPRYIRHLSATLVNRLPKNTANWAATGPMPAYPLLTANTPPLGIAALTDIPSLAGLSKQACGLPPLSSAQIEDIPAANL